MKHTLLFVLAAGLLASAAWAQTTAPPSPVILRENSPVATLLNQWAAEGTAGGLSDVAYDNRDRGHSMFPSAPFPQLKTITYTDAEREKRIDWGLTGTVRPGIVFGNSSTASMAPVAGSNPRSLYVGALEHLYAQYRGNNLYMYPAHHDFHPGHDGLNDAFYGDLFPTNTPFVLTSVGSSGTDQPFMKAVAVTLAAFRPEVKARLALTGRLMPTLQMIFRMCNKQVQKPEDYLTGAAHPVAFEGGQIDMLKMAQMAHDMQADNLPPLALLQLRHADEAVMWRDYFDPLPEALNPTPVVIARVFRGTAQERQWLVSAAESSDLNQRPLTFHWVLLSGDPAKVTIKPVNKSGSLVEITIRYHPRAPIAPGSAIESNRVDIGCFVHNGTYYSPPAFVTDFTLDNEARTYDAQGRILEMGYNQGESALVVSDWGALLAALAAEPPAPAVRLLVADPSPAQFTVVRELAVKYAPVAAAWAPLEKARLEAEAALQKATAENRAALDEAVKKARTAADEAAKARDTLLAAAQPGLPASLKDMIQARLKALLNDPAFYPAHAAAFDLKKLPYGPAAQLKSLHAYGILTDNAAALFTLNPLLPGEKPAVERLSVYQKAQIARFNGELLAAFIPGVKHDHRGNTVDLRLNLPKNWRDVYHYAPDGTPLGFTRYDGTAVTEFSPQGEIIVKLDRLNRPLITRAPKYERKTPATFDPRKGPDTTPLTFVPGPEVKYYGYENDADRVGHMEKIEAATATAPAR